MLLGAMPATMTASESAKDSLYLFSYTTDKDRNTTGLHFAWSADGKRWNKIGNEYSFVKSDYGAWGSGKRMYDPVLERRADGSWVCSWPVDKDGATLAYTETGDLLLWKPQDYFPAASVTSPNRNAQRSQVTFGDGSQATGQIHRVEKAVVEKLRLECDRAAYHAQLNGELMADDPTRFAGLKDVNVTITAQPGEAKEISDELFGVFFEDINYAADGGLYGELVQNRDFEYSEAELSKIKEWGPTYAWKTTGEATITIADNNPIHENNAHYAIVEAKAAGDGIANTGYDGISVTEGAKYRLSLFGQSLNGKSAKVKATLRSKDGKELASATITLPKGQWKKLEATLTANASASEAELALEATEAGRCAFDMVSLFPYDTFKGRKNGMRLDLAEAIADLKPQFVRFPGGCVAHGNGIQNIYQWKNTVGPLEQRKGMRNIWGYRQSMGLGFYEYFQFCEDLGAEPLPVLAAGVPCQNSSIGGAGQQGGIPLGKEMDEYIQDVLDLIEWANGDKNTTWGRLRAEAGHPKPFNLKYLGIGNEDLISEVFKERFKLIYDAVKAKYPDIVVVGTVGPFYEGSDYEFGWKFANELDIPIVDEHYYCPPGWFIHNQDFYDDYDRSKSKVYLGEYASHLPNRANTMETALSIAIYLTAVERNADVVQLSSYAPLMARRGHTQWRPDMMYFDNDGVQLTTDYYVQRMFGQNAGDTYIPATVASDNDREDVNVRIGQSIVRDSETGDLIVKLVNLLPVSVNCTLQLGDLLPEGAATEEECMTGKPSDSRATPVKTEGTIENGKAVEMAAYSFKVIRIKPAAQDKRK